MLCGLCWRYIPRVPEGGVMRSAIGSLVMNILLPALTFKVLYKAPIANDIWQVPIIAALSCLFCVALAWLLYSKIIGKPLGIFPSQQGVLILAAAWGNVTYLGLPVVTALVGEDYQRVPILFDLLSMTPLLWSLGVWIALRYGNTSQKLSPQKAISTFLRLPPLYAAILGLVCNLLGFVVPDFLLKACELASHAVAPLMIISVGMALRWGGIRQTLITLPAVVIKLCIAPILAFVLATALGMSGNVFRASMLESAMPTMVLTMVVAEQFFLDTEILAQAVAVSTLLSLITIPLIASLVP